MVAKQIWLIAAVLALAGCKEARDSSEVASVPAAAGFVGGAACAGCHSDEAAAWQGSHHDLAMQGAVPATVLGDFDDAEFVSGGIATRFYRRDGGYFVETDGPDGEPTEFSIAYTFGAVPLQQYLIELDGGRVQTLSIAWDSRPAAAGGQRWFDLYPDELIDYQDPLHWTGVYQRWNTMCADCHSTDLDKGYDVEADVFATRWTDIDVECEACHGPGSLHVSDPATPLPALPAMPRRWAFAPGESIAHLAEGQPSTAEIEVCAQCHSRRSQLTDAHMPGEPLLDAYQPVLLDAGLYHADGQIDGEVYVYGSFLQSAMAQAGVTCSDCHEPHSAELRADGNTLCAQCHLPTTFDRPEHHHHATGTEGARCTSCHMRSETYMEVDPRRDHSFRVPRPDVSAAIGSPNACSDCHDEQSVQWAAERIAEWYPDGRQTALHYGQVLYAARTWAAEAREELLTLIEDTGNPVIVRATAIALLADRMTLDDVAVIANALDSEEPLLQLAAIDATTGLDGARQVDLLQRFLTHDLLALRMAAARILLSSRDRLSARRQSDLDRALDEYLQTQRFNSDLPEGILNASGVSIEQSRLDEAESLLLEGIARYPAFAALYVNLADVYRLSGRDAESEAVLRNGLEVAPDDPALDVALAFALVRYGRADEALPLFRTAAELAPDQPNYPFLLAIAESDAGNVEQALDVLREAEAHSPGYPDLLFALATLLRDQGEIGAALNYARRLVALMPGDSRSVALLEQLERL